ncbi:MAG: dethiobiotin synthase [Candidatus Methylopumilus sp.]|nr:dethiobiotin synthase [Candidatus Methylopumilus sp.]
MFVTGTDTDAGKTYISAALLRHFAAQSLRVVGMKPVASGAKELDGVLHNSDVTQLRQASNVQADMRWINPYCFAPAIAPHIAAQQAGVAIDLQQIKQAYEQLCGMADVVVVEGAGGWLVPLNGQQTIADLAQLLDIPIVLVVRIRLGCINHALLSVADIQRRGLTLLGWVANCMEDEMPVMQENIATLQQLIAAPCLAVVGHHGQVNFNGI